MKNLSWLLNSGNPNSRSYKTTAHFSGQYQKLELVARQPRQKNHRTTAYFSGDSSGSSTQATQTVEATKPQPISLDDIKNLSWELNSGNPNSRSYKTTADFSGDKVFFDNSGNPNSRSYKTTANFSGDKVFFDNSGNPNSRSYKTTANFSGR
jgi:hypothetical protein